MKVLKRFPVTLLLLAALIVAALVTDTVTGPLASGWIRRIGFAPRDLWNVDLVRLFTSALVTHGRLVFLSALLGTAVGVGCLEWRGGSWVALGGFWGMHLVTLVAFSFIVTPPAGVPGDRLGEVLVMARDVGPSAGYLGSLGIALGLERARLNHLFAAAIWVLLIAALMLGVGAGPYQVVRSAGIAHVIAFSLGWGITRTLVWVRGKRPPPGAVQEPVGL